VYVVLAVSQVISLDGYTMEEKLHIAQQYLLPRQVSRHGLDGVSVTLAGDVMQSLIQHYTREAGVRGLEKQLAQLCRYVAAKVQVVVCVRRLCPAYSVGALRQCWRCRSRCVSMPCTTSMSCNCVAAVLVSRVFES
jgi:hypothetical protein